MERAWILIGMMGVGKSSLGAALAERSGREFVDTDRLLQHRLGRPIPQIFSIYGETAFRDHETSILKSIEPGPRVVSTGGGIIMREQNWDEIRRLGLSIYLSVPIEVLLERLKNSKKKRPLLQVEEWEDRVEDIISQRQAMYQRADLHVDLGNSDVEEGCARVEEALKQAGAW